MLPSATEVGEVKAAARRLREATAASGPPSISMGAALHQPGMGADQLFLRADATLYRVKRNGRDGVALP